MQRFARDLVNLSAIARSLLFVSGCLLLSGCAEEEKPITAASGKYQFNENEGGDSGAQTDNASSAVTGDEGEPAVVAQPPAAPVGLEPPANVPDASPNSPAPDVSTPDVAAPSNGISSETKDGPAVDPDSIAGLLKHIEDMDAKLEQARRTPPPIQLSREDQLAVMQGSASPEIMAVVKQARETHRQQQVAVVKSQVEAANKIRQREDAGDSLLVAVEALLTGYATLSNLGEADAEAKLVEIATEYQSHKDEGVSSYASGLLFNHTVADYASGQGVTAEQVVEKMQTLLAEKPLTEQLFTVLADTPNRMLQKNDFETGLQAIKVIANAFKDHESERVSSQVKEMLTQHSMINVQLLMRDMMEGKEGAADKVVQAAKELSTPSISPQAFQTLSRIVQIMEFSGRASEAGLVVKAMKAGLANAEDPRFSQAAGQMLASTEKRLALIGTQLEMTGVYLDGSAFDWKAYRGKYVLVDFWATWCGPCIEELPNVIANYEKYHDKGFEVVGVNLDDGAAEVVTFLESNPLPWKTIRAPEGEPQGFENENAVNCGVAGIPFIMLYDPEGKIIDLHVRGERLGERLAEIFANEGGQDDTSEAKEVSADSQETE